MGWRETLEASTWLPKDTRRRVERTATELGPPSHALLEYALSLKVQAAVDTWSDTVRDALRRDHERRVTDELLRHLIALGASKSFGRAKLRAAVDTVLAAAPDDVAAARLKVMDLQAGVSLSNGHSIFVAAARKANKTALKKTPHLGGPVPELSVFETVEVNLALARLALSKKDDAESRGLVKLAEAQLEWARGGSKGPAPQQKHLVAAPSPAKGPVFALARSALMEACNIDHVSGRGTSIKAAAPRGLELGDHAWWLEQVDEAIMTADARTAWERRGQTTKQPIVKCLFRGGDAKSRVWLALLADGTWALLAKLGKNWQSTEGDAESVGATMPDQWFAAAGPVIAERRA
ncbi:MAG: hypothetical protein U0228_22705 [Myxococcaceae bacterium]